MCKCMLLRRQRLRLARRSDHLHGWPARNWGDLDSGRRDGRSDLRCGESEILQSRRAVWGLHLRCAVDAKGVGEPPSKKPCYEEKAPDGRAEPSALARRMLRALIWKIDFLGRGLCLGQRLIGGALVDGITHDRLGRYGRRSRLRCWRLDCRGHQAAHASAVQLNR